MDRRSLLKLAAGGAVFTWVPSAELLAKTPGKRYAMIFDVRRCTGCLSCTVSCAVENRTEPGRERTEVAQMTVRTKTGEAVVAFPHQCNHCGNPPCVQVCPVKATYKRREDGIVVIDWTKCIHCMACVAACPYGARKADPEKRNPPEKCNFCIHRVEEGLLPACVETCIGKARVFGDLNDPESEVAQLVRDNKVYALLDGLGTKPSIFYIGLPDNLDENTFLELSPTDWQR